MSRISVRSISASFALRILSTTSSSSTTLTSWSNRRSAVATQAMTTPTSSTGSGPGGRQPRAPPASTRVPYSHRCAAAADWLAPALDVSHVPPLGPVHPDVFTPAEFIDLMTDVMRASEWGEALPYDE